jgi:hypothetical protein
MSRDVIALVPTVPDVPSVLAGMAAAGEDLLVLRVADGAVVQLCDSPDGDDVRPLLTIEEPILVAVPGEVARLLGDAVAAQISAPLWWIEVRAAGAPESALDLAYRFAATLVDRLGGITWPPAPTPPALPR